jgi:NADPH:quinone reductase-like Zn-dependent oxidoreductase
MRAVVVREYGSPDVLRVEDLEAPAPRANEVLIRVRAASLNPLDRARMRGRPLAMRLINGPRQPKNPALGADVAGEVHAVGAAVTEFRPGDHVVGLCTPHWGSLAEYVCVASSNVVRKPWRLKFEEAAATPVAACTALRGLRARVPLQPGQRVLINGAAGGVGTFAVQIAKAMGAHVTAVCSTPNAAMVSTIGADVVVDYTREDFTRNESRYDLVFDCVFNHPVSSIRRVLMPVGTHLIVGVMDDRYGWLMLQLLSAMPRSMFGRQKAMGLVGKRGGIREDLETIRELIESGKITPIVDRCYPLGETAEAMRYLETKHAR